MTDTTAMTMPQRQSLTGFTPRDAKGLAWLANEVVKSGMFKVGPRVMTGSEAFVVMMKGAELGLTPMQSLAEISVIKGKPFVSKDVLTARITRSPRCVRWAPDPNMDGKRCTIAFQVAGEEPASLTTLIDDIPERYFKPSSSGEPSNWTLVPEDMLFAWTVRRIARRWFPEALLDIGDAQTDYDETKIINVAAVEREVGRSEFGEHAGCGGTWVLQSNSRTGGAFLRCERCQATTAPPDEVRDLVRGTPEALTLAGPALEDGERPLTPEEVEAFDTMQGVHNAEQRAVEEASHEVEGAVAAVAAETTGKHSGPAEDEAGPPATGAEPRAESPEPPVGATLPLDDGGAALAEAAGIAQEEPPAMSRADVDTLVTAVLRAVTAARAQGTLEAARTILRAHAWDDTPLSSWLYHHPGELPGLLHDLGAEAK